MPATRAPRASKRKSQPWNPTELFDLTRLRACGEDVYISARAEIKRPQLVRVGSHIAIDSGFFCTVGAELSDYIHIGPAVTVIGGAKGLLRMGHFTTIGAGSRILCASDEFLGEGLVGMAPEPYRDRIIYGPVIVERFASIGTNVVVHPGVTLAEGSVVGSCSLVTKNTEPWTIYIGVPAKPVKTRPRAKMLAAAKALGYA